MATEEGGSFFSGTYTTSAGLPRLRAMVHSAWHAAARITAFTHCHNALATNDFTSGQQGQQGPINFP